MTDKELANMLRSIIKDELSPIDKRLATLEKGQKDLENGQKSLEKGLKEVKIELRYMWDDIKKIDERLTIQEKLRKVE